MMGYGLAGKRVRVRKTRIGVQGLEISYVWIKGKTILKIMSQQIYYMNSTTTEARPSNEPSVIKADNI